MFSELVVLGVVEGSRGLLFKEQSKNRGGITIASTVVRPGISFVCQQLTSASTVVRNIFCLSTAGVVTRSVVGKTHKYNGIHGGGRG